MSFNSDVTLSNFIVWQKGKRFKKLNFFSCLVAAFSIYIMVIPAILMDLFLWQYQLIYFSLMGIPKIKRSDYVIVDRYHLKGLSFFQKLDCAYCGYVNGLVAFAKVVSNQTEIYSCAIHHRIKRGGQEHQKKFFPYSKFDDKKRDSK